MGTTRLRKSTELSSREDYIVHQFATIKALNKIADKYFTLYYIDVASELTTMMRGMVPAFYVDPANPEHPSSYAFAGKANIDYVERIMYVMPYVNDKQKYIGDISAYKGLMIIPAEFNARIKDFRKTKLEPSVVMGDRPDGERFCQSLIMREVGQKRSDNYVVPFLELPNRRRESDDVYYRAIDRSIYQPFYRYLYEYLRRPIRYEPISPQDISELKDNGVLDIRTCAGDIITIAKNIFPVLDDTHTIAIGEVPDPCVPEDSGKAHYIIRDEAINELGAPYITVYTLIGILRI